MSREDKKDMRDATVTATHPTKGIHSRWVVGLFSVVAPMKLSHHMSFPFAKGVLLELVNLLFKLRRGGGGKKGVDVPGS